MKRENAAESMPVQNVHKPQTSLFWKPITRRIEAVEEAMPEDKPNFSTQLHV